MSETHRLRLDLATPLKKRSKWVNKTERDPLDFYPTPEPVTAVLRDWLARQGAGKLPAGSWLDPAAGEGAIIRAMQPLTGERSWYAVELSGPRFETLIADEGLAWRGAFCRDALVFEWPSAHVVENPPFFLLDEFWKKTAAHRAKHGVWCAALTPVAWWHAEKRAAYVRPDYKLALGWRPSFRTAPGAKPKSMQDYEWSVLAPTPMPFTRWERLEKPAGA